MTALYTGGCHCGQVRFALTPPLRDVLACHCTQCRKVSGHFWAATSVPHDRFTLTCDIGLRWYSSSDTAKRGFCGGCGSSLFWQPKGEARISVAAGALDGPTGLVTTEHWFLGDRGDYCAPKSAPHPTTLHGSCLCGAHQLSLPGPMGAVSACHCIQCRKLSGHYSASFDANEDTVVWQSEEPLCQYTTPGGASRGFCGRCGSSLTFRAADGGFAIEAGCIDGSTGGYLHTHGFIEEKADYYGLDDPKD